MPEPSERQLHREEAERLRVAETHRLRASAQGARSFVEEGRPEERALRREERGQRLVATGRVLAAFGSLRVLLSALIGSLLLGGVLSLLWPPLFFVALPAFVCSWVGGALGRLGRG